MAKDILLDDDGDLLERDGDLVIGESTMQEVGIILELNQGNLLNAPLLGPNLVQLINSKASQIEIKTRVKQHLAQDGKDYEEIRKLLRINGHLL